MFHANPYIDFHRRCAVVATRPDIPGGVQPKNSLGDYLTKGMQDIAMWFFIIMPVTLLALITSVKRYFKYILKCFMIKFLQSFGKG